MRSRMTSSPSGPVAAPSRCLRGLVVHGDDHIVHIRIGQRSEVWNIATAQLKGPLSWRGGGRGRDDLVEEITKAWVVLHRYRGADRKQRIHSGHEILALT